MGPEVRAVLWDLDGTLADTHPLIHQCVDETFREHFARPFDFELWKRGVGHPLERVLRMGFEAYGIACADTAPLIRFYRERLKSYESCVRPFPGALETVRLLIRSGYRQGIVTTKFSEACARHLLTLGLDGCFDVVVTGDHCRRHKPDPQPFQIALEGLALEPETCVMVGDSAADVSGARAAGIGTIAALWGSLDREAVLALEPDHIANHPDEVALILEASR